MNLRWSRKAADGAPPEMPMIVDQTEHRCARSGCQCMIHESQRWCSDQCRDAGPSADAEPCPCGHAPCVAASRPA